MLKINVVVDLSAYSNKLEKRTDFRFLALGGSGSQIISLAYELMESGVDLRLFVFHKGDMGLVHSNDQVYYFVGCKIPWNYLTEQKAVNILRYDSLYKKLETQLTVNNVRHIVWCHNVIKDSEYTSLASNSLVERIVNVGVNQVLNYFDNDAFIKSVVIPNAFYDIDLLPSCQNIKKPSNHDVVYLGSIVPSKGFHLLAMAWREVCIYFPDARLHIIGSGHLYNPDARLGPLGLAEESYEKSFANYISENGLLDSNIIHHGLLSTDKYKILANCSVGVPNPSGRTETFCLSAIEMQVMGCKIVSKSYLGLNETIIDKRYMYRNEKSLKQNLLRALRDTGDVDVNFMRTEIRAKYGKQTIVDQWLDIHSANQVSVRYSQLDFQNKLRYINKYIRNKIPQWPTVSRFLEVIDNVFDLNLSRW